MYNVKITESLKTFQYRLPTEPEKMLYDFYFLVGYCRGAFSDNKVLSFVIEEAVEDCTKALQKHMLKALKWSLTCEARHTVKMTLSGEIAKLKPESKKLLIAFIKELELLDSSKLQGLLSKLDSERTVDAKVNKAAARSPDVWTDNVYGEIPGRGDSFAVVNIAMKAACKKLKVTDKKLAAFFEDIYNLDWANSFGGKAWLGIANCYTNLLEAKDVSARIVWIDHAYDLQHNTDTVFNKVPAYYKNGGFSWLARALDWKRDATDPREFYDRVSGSLKEVVAYISYHLYGKSILGREADVPFEAPQMPVNKKTQKKSSSIKELKPGTELKIDSDSVAKYLEAHPDNDEGFINFIVEMGVDVKLLITSVITSEEGSPKDFIGCAVLSIDGESAGSVNYDKVSNRFLYNMPSKDKNAFPRVANYGWFFFEEEMLKELAGLSAQQGNVPSFEEALKNSKNLYRLEFPRKTPERDLRFISSEEYFKYLQFFKIPIEFYVAAGPNSFIVVTKEGINTPDDEGYNSGISHMNQQFLWTLVGSQGSKLLAKMKKELGLSEKTLARYIATSKLKQLYEKGYITIVNRGVSSKEEPAAQPLAEKLPYDKRDILNSLIKARTSWPQDAEHRDIVFLNMLNANLASAKAKRLYIAKVVRKGKSGYYEVQVLDDLTDEQRSDLGLHHGSDTTPHSSKNPSNRYYAKSDEIVPTTEYAVSISNKGDSTAELAWLKDISKNTIHEYLNYNTPADITMYGRIMRYADYENDAHDRIAIVSFLAVLEGRVGAKELDAKTIKAAIPSRVLRKFGEPYDEQNKYCLRIPLSVLNLTNEAKTVLIELGYA